MPEITGAIIGALAAVGIPLIAWFSRRATHVGRLLLRVERLGTAFAVMPISAERDTFSVHLRQAIGELNEWLDQETAKRRKILRWVSGVTYAAGVSGAVWMVQSLDEGAKPWLSPVIGIVAGVAVSAISLGTQGLLDRSARVKRDSAARAAEAKEAEARMEILRF
jgi:hypothetical protein